LNPAGCRVNKKSWHKWATKARAQESAGSSWFFYFSVKEEGMKRLRYRVLAAAMAVAAALAFTVAASAHFHTYWPKVEGCYGKPGEAVTWQYFWGHPFEMIIYDAVEPKFFVVGPEGKREPVSAQAVNLKDPESGQERQAYEMAYKPAAVGDYYLCLEAQPYFIPEEKIFWQDLVKEPWHVMAEKGWDQKVGLEVEIVPLTRPYGWPAGSVFKGQALFQGKPLKGATVEIEKFNGFFVPPDKLPKNRFGEENTPLITRTVKTDDQGYLTCTLDSPGWWVMAVGHRHGKKTQEGQAYPVEKRGYLWVYVEPAPAPLAPAAGK
jgi:cobalt/nickel transport protein